MIKIDRKQNPTFTKYDEQIVQDSLKIDFFKKCYLCEEVTRHFEVEHFYPQISHPQLTNEYSNLFYSCQKCNKIKPKQTNTTQEKEILNCCEIDVEEYIKLSLNMQECKVDVEQIKEDNSLEVKIKNTIALLNRIYNGKDSQSNSCEDLKDDIIQEIEKFRKILDKYETTKLKKASLEEIEDNLKVNSSYSTFKRWIIKDNENLKKQFIQYIN